MNSISGLVVERNNLRIIQTKIMRMRDQKHRLYTILKCPLREDRHICLWNVGILSLVLRSMHSIYLLGSPPCLRLVPETEWHPLSPKSPYSRQTCTVDVYQLKSTFYPRSTPNSDMSLTSTERRISEMKK